MSSSTTRRIGQFGSLGTAIAGFGLWRKLSPARKHQLRSRIEHLVGRGQGQSVAAPPEVAERVAAATAPSEEIVPGDLTSPQTVSDPKLEERRAVEAAARERESRESSVTKFEEIRQQQEADRAEHASVLADAPD